MLGLKPWQKLVWWLFLICLLSVYLFRRLEALQSGHSAPIDVFVFLVWAALLLSPLFKELHFLGLGFKQELEETRKQLSGQIEAMEYRIQSSVAVNPQFNVGVFPTPPPDSSLPALQQKLDEILGEVTKKTSVSSKGDWEPQSGSERVEYLFRVRLQIETELRRLYKELSGIDAPRTGALRFLPNLISSGVLSDQMAIALREVYSVCSPAIHGESVSDAQVQFVQGVAPQLITKLKASRAAA